MLLISAFLGGPAGAADIVWLSPPPDEQRARVQALPGAGRELPAVVFRAGPVAASPRDQDAYRRLGEVLAAVRAFEDRLDGELVIMDDLQVALDAVTLVRGKEDRDTLFRALAYQGFAVDRYFADGLAADPKAEPWRVDLGEVVVRPWRDAIALEPTREVTAYEIAEAPQRVAFNATRAHVAAALPGGLRVTGVPEGATLRVDGEPRDASSAVLRLPPGVHRVHVERDGGVLARWVVDLTPGGSETLAVEFDDAGWSRFVGGLADGVPVPASLEPALSAAGGEIWLARPGDREPELFAVTASGVRRVPLPRPEVEVAPRRLSWAIVGGLSGGWLSSGDFYAQNPAVAPRTRATVNAMSFGPNLALELDIGRFRTGVGLDAPWTPGEHHVALYGERSTRIRPTPHVTVGLPWVSATLGYLFPYHPIVGGRVALPLGDLEIRGDVRVGQPGLFVRANGTRYQTLPVYTATLGVALRLRLQRD